jgi:hypothetical protein
VGNLRRSLILCKRIWIGKAVVNCLSSVYKWQRTKEKASDSAARGREKGGSAITPEGSGNIEIPHSLSRTTGYCKNNSVHTYFHWLCHVELSTVEGDLFVVSIKFTIK